MGCTSSVGLEKLVASSAGEIAFRHCSLRYGKR